MQYSDVLDPAGIMTVSRVDPVSAEKARKVTMDIKKQVNSTAVGKRPYKLAVIGGYYVAKNEHF